MKKRHIPLILLTGFLFLTIPMKAQKPGFNPDLSWNTIRAEYGALIPLGPVPKSSTGVFSLSYTRRYSGHWGWRGGVQYAPFDAYAENYMGLPLAVVFRSSTNSFDGRLQRAFDDSLEDASRNASVYRGDAYGKDRTEKDIVANMLSVFLRRTEIFAGITPGYLWGEESRFSLTADAGITLSIPLWRFSLDFTPAFHYLFTDSIGEHPTPWLFSVSGGLSFLF